ncbi:hypothetical protein FB451DRAFT_1280218 [Mycena latifolia]|nr:hypothetical protein FB451DRAFT_1280218 [Mycena latifolia]
MQIGRSAKNDFRRMQALNLDLRGSKYGPPGRGALPVSRTQNVANYCSLPPELKTTIVKEFLCVVNLEELSKWTAIDVVFHQVLQGFRFRHVNPRTFQEAFDLLEIFSFNQEIAKAVRTLQISVSLGKPPEKNPFDHDPPNTPHASDDETPSSTTGEYDFEDHATQAKKFWALWQEHSPWLTRIHTLTVCFHHTDTSFLSRWIQHGQLATLQSLSKLHLCPVWEEHTGQWRVEDRHPSGRDYGPWDDEHWATSLCHSDISHIELLILTTPVYPFWPPTQQAVDKLLESWLGPLPPSSQLKKFIVHCGNDEGMRFAPYHDHLDLPPGLNSGKLTYRTALPASQDTSWELPTLKWKRIETSSRSWTWQEDMGSSTYCGLGEHKYFEGLYHPQVEPPAYILGYEQDLFFERGVWG